MQDTTPKTSDQLYLEKLEFDPSLRVSWLNFFVSNFRVVILLIALLTGWGLYSFFSLARESSPEVKMPIAIVSTAYPGASPSDVEELVSKKIETKIAALKGVTKITSQSLNSFSSIKVEFDSKEDVTDALRRLTDKVKEAKPDLPADAKESSVMEVSMNDAPIWTIAISGPSDGYILHENAKAIKEEIEKIPGVREVRISGGDEKEFSVSYDPAKLQFFGVSADQANAAIAASNLAIPAGIFEGEKYAYPVRSDSRFFTAEDLGSVPVAHSDAGSIVYVRDIARVEESVIKKTVFSRLSVAGSPAQNAVTLDVIKKSGGNIVTTVAQAKQAADAVVSSFSDGTKYDVMTDSSERIAKDFDQLTHDFLFTILLVGGLLLIIVGAKEALVAGLAIPLVFFVAFGVMDLTGTSLNFLSIFALLLSLGLLVDDAIVVVSATKQYLKTGKFTPEEAVLLVLNDFKVVLTTTTLTTVWAFLPLLMATGIIGSFIRSIPITVSVVLLASLLIALMVNHPLAAVLERIRLGKRQFFTLGVLLFATAFASFVFGGFVLMAIGVLSLAALFFMLRWWSRGGADALVQNDMRMREEWGSDERIKEKLRLQSSHENEDRTFASRLMHGIVHFDRVLPLYEKYLRRALATDATRKTILSVVAALFAGALMLPAFGVVVTEFFPATDSNAVYVNIEAPVGTKLSETDAIVRKVEEALSSYKEIKNYSTIVGSQNGASGRSLSASSHKASITITLKDKEERTIASYDFATLLRKNLASLSGGRISVDTARAGPPSGAAFEARISGDDLAVLEKNAARYKEILSGISSVVNADISLRESPVQYTFRLRPDDMERNYLNSAYVGSALRLAISGVKVTTVLRDNNQIDVVARFDETKIPDLASLQNLQILNLRKQPVYVKDVADIQLQNTVETITRIDQKRTVVLSAGVEGQARPAQILTMFKQGIKKDPLPKGYSISYGGENEQNNESVMSILRAMLVAAVLIVSTLVIQFNSFKKAFIVLITLPLALIGVFAGLAVSGIPLSFPGLIGILALFGIVVKNAIILIDKMNLNIRVGIPFQEAVVDAGKSRLEAIFITSFCTIAGLIPITVSNATWTALGSAVIFGLLVSSFLTLFVVPVLFVTFIREDERF